MEVILPILILAWIFVMGYFAASRFGGTLDEILPHSDSRREEEETDCAEADPAPDPPHR